LKSSSSTSFKKLSPYAPRVVSLNYVAFPIDNNALIGSVPPDGTVSILCRNRAGTATLCGFSEFTTPSTPPKKYKTNTNSGKILICIHGEPDCTVAIGTTDSYDYDNAETWQYDVSNCTVNTSHYTHYVIDGPDLTCVWSNTGTPHVEVNGVGAIGDPEEIHPGYTIFRSPTVYNYVPNTSYCQQIFPYNLSFSGEQFQTLSNEDTEEDAIERVFPDPDSGWSAFQSPEGEGCCTTSRQLRAPDSFSLSFRQVEFKVDGEGWAFNPTINVVVYRRLIGSVDWENWQTLTYTPTVVGGGFSFIDSVPELVGYETYVSAPGTCAPL